MSARRLASLALVVAPLLLGACATKEAQHRDWSDYDGPGAEYFQKEELVFWEPDDPAEPTNRVVMDVVNFGAEYVVAPLAWVWRRVTPKAFRTGLTNVGKNITYPVRLVSNLVQGDWDTAGVETQRFAINTTIGVLGWTDSAKNRGIDAPRAQDTGLAFRHYGWKESAYTAVPRPTVRDSVGFVPDLLLDPLTYVPGASIGRTFNDASDGIDKYVDFVNTTYDPYRLARIARHLDRTLEETDREYAAGVGGAVDTVQYVFLGVMDREFLDRAEEDEIEIAATGHELGYTYWLQDHPAPVMFVLPGTGGHRNAESTAAVAELAYRAGYHAVAISSTLNFEFIANGATVDFPGFALADAHDAHVAMTAIDARLREEHGALMGKRRAVMGMSMGAFHALFMAAVEEQSRQEGLVPLDGYVALNPPVSLVNAASGFDDYFNLPLKYFPDDRETQHERIKALFRHVIDVAGGGDLRPGKPVPLNDVQAQFLIGVAFRLTLTDILDQARALGRTDGFFLTPRTNRDRSASYVELQRYSFMEYMYAFMLPEQARRRADISNDEAGAKRLAWLSDLRSLQLPLTRNPRVRVFSNRNEILLREGDVRFLQDTFGGRLQLNEEGGHLGNLWQPEVRAGLVEELRGLVPHQ